MTIRAATWEYLDTLGPCVISGWGLTDHVSQVTGVRVYPSSVLKAAKGYADTSGAIFRCISSRKSRYQFVPGVKVSGAIIE
jgi:hypothetical protein